MSFFDSYDYWNLDEDWFVAGYSHEGKVAVQFRPNRAAMIRAIKAAYDGDGLTNEQLRKEIAWHKEYA